MSTDDFNNPKFTHLIIASNNPMPVYHIDLPSAIKEGEEGIKKDPSVTYQIFQLRTEIKGTVEVKRRDFLGATLV